MTFKRSPYEFKTPQICEALRVTRNTLYRWEQMGIISFPRDRHGDRIVTSEQLQELIQAFSPLGDQQWHPKI